MNTFSESATDTDTLGLIVAATAWIAALIVARCNTAPADGDLEFPTLPVWLARILARFL